jgi:hypothetical protein
LLEKFKGINDCKEEMIPVEKAIDLLENDTNKHYDFRDSPLCSTQENTHSTPFSLVKEVEVPMVFYQAVFINNVSPSIGNKPIKEKNLCKIHNNFEIIIRLLIDENQTPYFIAKWLRMLIKLLFFVFQYFIVLRTRSLKIHKSASAESKEYKI